MSLDECQIANALTDGWISTRKSASEKQSAGHFNAF